jgi:4-hydroxy-tetrahydrodipicolinate synthase
MACFPNVITAVPTPFLYNEIDFASFDKLLDFQSSNSVEAILVAGSTGEFHSLTKQEWVSLLKFAVSKLKNKVLIIAGCSLNSTQQAVEYAKEAESLGVDAILSVSPYYNKPQQEGIVSHFKAINDSISIPIMLYNVPSRTANQITNDTIIKIITSCPNVTSLKDATGNIALLVDLKEKLFANEIEFFQLMSGEDITQIAFNASGGSGIVSVVSNVDPSLILSIQKACFSNDFQDALGYQNYLSTMSNILFREVNPVPVKYILKKLDIFTSAEVRLPLYNLTKESEEFIDFYLKK